MSADPDFGRPRGDEELGQLARIIGVSFNYPAEKMRERFPLVGMEHLRVYRQGSRVVAGLWVIPMGQWFGGKSVPMTGVAAVGVGPESRGQGSAAELMKNTLREMRDSGVPLSGLYPATQSLYRLVGYECAGARYSIKIAPKDIRIKDRELSLRPAGGEDKEAIAETYRTHARGFDGHLDRGPYVWDRVYELRGTPATGYVVEEEGRITGYVFLLQKEAESGPYKLMLTDLTAVTPGAGRRLWSFLADHRSMVPEVSWFGGPNHPLLMLPQERHYELSLQIFWMTRILDVAAALEARGYPPGVRNRIHLEIEDDVIPENTGRYVLEVEDGSARVTRGGNGSLRMHIRGLAPLYSGFFSPAQLRAAELLLGDAGEVEKAAGLFVGSAPWMPDMF